jgi:RNA polymerase sigma factor (sigma-70 family)
MTTLSNIPETINDDAQLVGQSLAGNRDAFREIVERHQSLICSLAYSATGSVSQSEDIAQETFLAAWKGLATLREPAKLRAWLSSIVRCLIAKHFRRQQHEPVHCAEPLDETSGAVSMEPLPAEQTISREEETILWRSLERIPEIYREPLVLFYREHRSIEAVAADLGLTEDAVKQRLSRGRKLLHEQVLAFVEGTLERTNPGKAFTVGVLAALPLLATSAKAATAGTAAAKSGALAKAGGIFLKTIYRFLPLGVLVSLGGWLGYKMGCDAAEPSVPRRESVARFWGILLASIVAFVLLPVLLWIPLMLLFGGKENFLAVMRVWLDVMFGLVVTALVLWIWQRRKDPRPDVAGAPRKRTAFLVWLVALATIFAVSFIALGLSDSNSHVQFINTPTAQKLIAEKSGVAEFFVMQSRNGQRQLWIEFTQNGSVSKNIAPADKATFDLLAQKGIQYPIYVEGRDWGIFGWQGRFLMLLLFVVAIAGIAVFLTLSLKKQTRQLIMTNRTIIGIVATIIVAALIVTPLVMANHHRVNVVHPNRVTQSLTTDDAAKAKQVANDFFVALGKGDWNQIAALCPPGFSLADQLNDQQKDELKGVQLISLGDPFKKPSYAGVFVPYHIRFKDGEEKNFNLAVRNDNPEQKWYFDGGF